MRRSEVRQIRVFRYYYTDSRSVMNHPPPAIATDIPHTAVIDPASYHSTTRSPLQVTIPHGYAVSDKVNA